MGSNDMAMAVRWVERVVLRSLGKIMQKYITTNKNLQLSSTWQDVDWEWDL